MPSFVLRGLNASASTLAEAEEHDDIVFLRAEASQSRFTGPLWSLWLWLDCARTAWPHAKLIGKAESDVWLHLPGIASRLRADFEALGRRDPQLPSLPSIYWGVVESFHWDIYSQRPHGFGYKFGAWQPRCTMRKSVNGKTVTTIGLPEHPSTDQQAYLGQFPFAKGPLVLMSNHLVVEMLREGSWAWSSLQEITRQANAGDTRVIPPGHGVVVYPQDDAWLGLAMATSVRGGAAAQGEGRSRRARTQAPLAVLHAGSVIYAEGVADRAYPLHTTTLIWHNGHSMNKYDHGHPNGTGLAQRIENVHRRMTLPETRRCDSPNVTLNCGGDGSPPWRSCVGAEWERCLVVHNYEACPKNRLYL